MCGDRVGYQVGIYIFGGTNDLRHCVEFPSALRTGYTVCDAHDIRVPFNACNYCVAHATIPQAHAMSGCYCKN